MAETSKPPPAKAGMSRFIMFFMIILTVFVLFDPTLRSALGGAMSFVMNPIIGFGGAYPILTLLFAGMITSTVSIAGRHFFVDWVAQAKTQKIMSAFNKERRDAMMKQNLAKLKKLNEMSSEIMQDSMKQTMNQMKPLAFTMLIIIVLFAWLYSFIAYEAVDTAYSVPWAFNANLVHSTLLPNWLLVYILISIPFGQVVGRLLKYFTFKKTLRERGILD